MPSDLALKTDASLPKPLPPRIEEILVAAKTAFVAKGFDGASMQDLARAAGMSAGNFYRYFDSKEALIVAIVARELAQISAVFEAILRSPDPRDSFLAALDAQMQQHLREDDGSIWAEIEAAALRRPAVGEILNDMMSQVTEYQMRVFARIAGTSVDDVAARYGAHAAMIMMMVRGTAMSTTCPGGLRPSEAEVQALRALVLRTVATLLTEIASSPEAT
jgi:AcrR family transcriptional regulator